MIPQRKEQGLDNRAIGRSVLTIVLGLAILVSIGFLLFSGVFIDGGSGDSEADSSTGESEADTEENETTNDTDEESENGESDENETTNDNDDEIEPDVAEIDVTVWDKEEGDPLGAGELFLRTETGDPIQQVQLTGGEHTFDDLAPGEEYIVTAESGDWPEERVAFTAGEQDTAEMTVGYEFQSADSFRYVSYNDYDGPETYSILEARGEYASNGNALYYNQRLRHDGSDAREVQYYTEGGLDGETWSYIQDRGVDEMDDTVGMGYAVAPYNDPVFKGLDAYDEDEREFIERVEGDGMDGRYIGEWTEGKELDLYHVDVSSQYSEGHGTAYDEVRAYVDPDTGYVVRTETDIAKYEGWTQTDAEIVFEFKNHEETVEVDIELEEMGLEEPF